MITPKDSKDKKKTNDSVPTFSLATRYDNDGRWFFEKYHKKLMRDAIRNAYRCGCKYVDGIVTPKLRTDDLESLFIIHRCKKND